MTDHASAPDQDHPAANDSQPSRSLISRLARRAFWLLIVLAAIVATLPTLVARTELRHEIFSVLRPGVPEGIKVDAASLGWFSPVVLRNVSVPDLQGRRLITMDRIQTDRPLWELATRPEDVGRITLSGLDIHIEQHADGSNLGDVLARLQTTPPRRSRPRVRLEVHNAQLEMADESGSPLLACASIDGHFDDLRHGDTPATAALTAATLQPSPNGRFDGSVTWTPASRDNEVVGPGNLEVQLTEWPLDAVAPIIERLIGVQAFAGEVTLAVGAKWDALATDGGKVEFGLDVVNFDALLSTTESSPPQPVQAQNARLHLRGQYDGVRDRLELVDSRLDTQWAAGGIRGALTKLRGPCLCDLTGDLTLKLDALPNLLPPTVREEVEITGLETRRIRLFGPLRPTTAATPDEAHAVANEQPDELIVETTLLWSLIEAYGVSSPNGELAVRYHRDHLTLEPTDVPLSSGRVTSLPNLRLGGETPVLEFDGQPLLQRIAFSDELCRGWMRYLSPLMANATSVDGSFSLRVDEASIPTDRLAHGDLEGTLSIHSARVGPGPLTKQLIGIIQQFRGIAERQPPAMREQPDGWLTIADQDVRFGIRKGRVDHQNLTLQIGPAAIESSGSVGIVDDSLDLLLVVHFPESWFENRPLLAQLRGDGLRIPIRGTLNQPQIDARPLRDFGRGIGLRAADGLLRRLLERPDRE